MYVFFIFFQNYTPEHFTFHRNSKSAEHSSLETKLKYDDWNEIGWNSKSAEHSSLEAKLKWQPKRNWQLWTKAYEVSSYIHFFFLLEHFFLTSGDIQTKKGKWFGF